MLRCKRDLRKTTANSDKLETQEGVIVKRHVWLLVLLTVLLTLGGCTARPVAPAAPTIHFGEDMCSDCGMIINEPRFAAAYAAQQGEGSYQTFIFDDIGDMLRHMQQNTTLTGAGWWVHDYDSEEWIDATTAFYVVSDQIKTPMNHGIAAFSAEDAANTLAAEVGGDVLDWDKVRAMQIMTKHM